MDYAMNRLSDQVTTVLGLCELLQEEAYGALSPQQKRVLGDAILAAREIKDLVRENPPQFVHD